MSTDLLDDDVLSPEDAAQVASLDAVRERLVADAQSWAVQLGEFAALSLRAEQAGPQVRRTLALELAGSWQVGQSTAERWLAEAERMHDALPLTPELLGSGVLLRHQAVVLLHRTLQCTPEVASEVEAQVLPAGLDLIPSDLARKVDRARLRIEAEHADADELARQEAEKVAGRRTWMRPTEDGMAVAGALLTPEQGVAWAAGMDALERRERLADRAAGIKRTAISAGRTCSPHCPRWYSPAPPRTGRPVGSPTHALPWSPARPSRCSTRATGTVTEFPCGRGCSAPSRSPRLSS